MTPKQISVVHLAKKRLELDNSTYRAVLMKYAGTESAKDLDQAGFERVMSHFNRLGFRSDWLKRTYGHRQGFASPRQIDLIRNLWVEWSDEGNETGLDHWLERKFGVSALRFATPAVAHKAITALKAMKTRKRPAA
ncbi:regulatory protein GemA [Methyloceanibacter sp.]|uniref:regulatory protein GemA n=1 Tax=Methyloceanibacter sp. TaxID=1965321 RepID=UPI002BB4EE86|nr:regulatory protein GemA [Methyloceanibacter sp.]HML92213.1 regulatory protein GemA [Methyloceanibacter sp.]